MASIYKLFESETSGLDYDPSEMVNDYWQGTAFPNQPLGRLIIGKKEIISSIER